MFRTGDQRATSRPLQLPRDVPARLAGIVVKVSGAGTLAITLAVQALVAAAALVVPVLAPVLSASAGVGAALVGVSVSLMYVGAMPGSLLACAWLARLRSTRARQFGLAPCAHGLLCRLSVPHLLAPWAAVILSLAVGPIT